jgi:hypothetical protein
VVDGQEFLESPESHEICVKMSRMSKSNPFLVNIIAYSVWSMMIALIAWYACNLNDIVVNYWSIVLALNCIYMLATPIAGTVQKE